MTSLDPKSQAYLAAVASDFKIFVTRAFATIYPSQVFHDNWHIEAIVHALEQNMSGKKRRLIINLPPRHLKSFLVSVCLPAFLLSQDPTQKIFCVSYSDDLAKTIARDFKRLMESTWYRALFPTVKPIKSTENEFITDLGGFRLALSVHGSITGRGADLIIIDDPCRPEDAISDKARSSVNDWFRSTLLSRLNDKHTGGLIVVMQRLHVNDLTGFIESSGNFHKLSFPAIAIRDQVIELRSGGTYHRRAGEALQPGREDVEILNRLRDELTPFHFETQYQQSPRAPDGQIFKRKYFKVLEENPPLKDTGELFLSIDSALSTSMTSDFTAISVVYIDMGRVYVLAAERGRWDYETLKTKAMEWTAKLARHERPVNVLIEYAGNGISLVQYLEKMRDNRIRLNYRRPSEDKVTRAARVLPWVEAGIYLVSKPGANAWVEPYLNEFLCFPNGSNDDQVDSLVQLLHLKKVALLQDPRHLDVV